MGIELIQPAFTMRIKNIEEGSPAATTGKLKPGQIIESINGQTLKDDGRTSDPHWIWSSDHLMDLTHFQALRMEVKTVEGAAYLFVESGVHRVKPVPGWKPSWLVLEKQ